jgi:TolB-like protein/Flp pilus assembly protein TadD
VSDNSWLGRTFGELSRRKVVRAGAAYAFVAWLLVQIADTVLPAFGGSDAAMRLIIIVLLIGFPVAIVVAWLYDFTRFGLQRTTDTSAAPSRGARTVDLVIIGALAVAVGVLLWRGQQSPTRPPAADATAAAIERAAGGASVAVLPFENLSADPNNEIFADGLAEDVLIRLAKIDTLRVPGRTSSFRYRGVREEISEIGRALNVGALLEGSVQAYANTLKVTVRLVKVSDGFEIWSQRYTRKMTDVFAIQEQIARDVADNLKIELVGLPADAVERPTDNMDAYRLYLRGRNEWHKRTSASIEAAIDLFQRAIALDDRFALAWSGLADAYNFASNYGNMDKVESLDKGLAAAQRALALDPDLAEAHASLGLVLSDKGKFQEAAAAFLRAIDLNPGFANAHMWYAGVLSWVDPEAALEQRRIAADLEPLSPIAVQLLGDTLFDLGRVDEARREFLKILEFAPEYPLVYFNLATMANADNDYVSAVRYLRKANELDSGRAATMVALAQMYAGLGDLDRAREWLDRATAIGPDQLNVINMQLAMLQLSGDYAGMQQVIERKLADDDNFFSAYVNRAVIAFDNERYVEAANWVKKIFVRFAGPDAPEDDERIYRVTDDSMFGVIYLANASVRSGNREFGVRLADRVLEHVQSRQQSGFNSSDLMYVTAGAHVARGEHKRALATVREMADRGFPGYLRMERDALFKPIRNELEFKVSVDYIRNNAQAQLAQLNET